jgi:hypothetical protein
MLMAQKEIGYIDEPSLEGDIPDDISNKEYKIDS